MRGDLNRQGMRGWTRKRIGRNGTRVGLLLPERARSECARSTAAVRPDTGAVPEEVKRASLEGWGGWPDDLLCSRNARPQKALVERAQWKINQPPSLKKK
jgi:hypothetical protein